jgi:cytochrome oxidase Cu insertion factor (SCO1/SenC/PrrC family)
MPRSLRILAIFSATLLICGVAALAYIQITVRGSREHLRATAVDPLTPREMYQGVVIPPFAGRTQANAPVDQSIFDGKITVLSFIFTHCPLACPAITAQVKQMTDELKNTSTQFVSISLDPANDTPAALTKWGESFQSDFSRWTFINGGPGTHERILVDTFKEHLALDDSMPVKLDDGTTMPNIVHPLYIYLIGPDRNVIDRFSTKRPEEMSALVARANLAAVTLASRQAKGKP